MKLNNKDDLIQKKKIILLIQGLHQIHKRPMHVKHYEKLLKFLPYPTVEEINRLFGSWTNLLIEAEVLESLSIEDIETFDFKNRTLKEIGLKKMSVDESLHFCSSIIGSKFSVKEYSEIRKQHPYMKSSGTIIVHYGTWQKALSTCGMIAKGHYSDQDCINALKQAYDDLNTKGNLFNSVNYSVWSKENNQPTLTTIVVRFSGWNNAVKIMKEH